MRARGPPKTEPFNLVSRRHPPSTTLTGKPDQSGTPKLDERLTFVQYERTVIQLLRYAMEWDGHTQTAAQRRYK